MENDFTIDSKTEICWWRRTKYKEENNWIEKKSETEADWRTKKNCGRRKNEKTVGTEEYTEEHTEEEEMENRRKRATELKRNRRKVIREKQKEKKTTKI